MGKVLSFWGKGGVGKTTCASSVAVRLANDGFKTLLLSSDPAPSLSDILDLEIGPSPKRVNGINLYALELDEEAVTQMWKKRFGEEVYEVISSFLPVDREVIDYVAGAPGIGDEFALAFLLDLYKRGDYDVIVWDTAPAGGTLKLLKLEDKFYKHLIEASKLYLSVKSILRKIRMREDKEPLEILNSWRALAEECLSLVSSRGFKAHIVTIPEWLSVVQTGRIIRELRMFKANLGKLIVNQVIVNADHSTLAAKKHLHEKYLGEIKSKFSDLEVLVIPAQPYEVKGLEKLMAFSENLEELIRGVEG